MERKGNGLHATPGNVTSSWTDELPREQARDKVDVEMEMGKLQGTGVCSISLKLLRINKNSKASVIQNKAGRTEDNNREGRGSVVIQDRRTDKR